MAVKQWGITTLDSQVEKVKAVHFESENGNGEEFWDADVTFASRPSTTRTKSENTSK